MPGSSARSKPAAAHSEARPRAESFTVGGVTGVALLPVPRPSGVELQAERLGRLGEVVLVDENDGGELAADGEGVGRLDVDARLGDLLQHRMVTADLIGVFDPADRL